MRGFVVPALVAVVAAGCIARPRAVFDDVVALVETRFYDRSLRGLPWEDLVAAARSRLRSDSDLAEVQSVVNGLLAHLEASHTRLYTRDDLDYWALRSIFSHDLDGQPLRHIGAFFEERAGRWFVADVLEAAPAAQAGLRHGDEIVAVAGQPLRPVASFDVAGPVEVTRRRTAGGAVERVSVSPRFESVQRALYRASVASERVFEHDGREIGYLRLWAGTHEAFERLLADFARRMAGRGVNGLILDLRGGYGGAHPGYVAPFLDPDGDGQPTEALYAGPLAVLVDRGTRSGKEWITQILKEERRALLVGTRTAGATLAGSLFELQRDEALLFLAVAEGIVELEGVGVAPDVEIARPLPHAGGADPVLEGALERFRHWPSIDAR